MPGKHVAGADEPCRRCKESASVIVVRSEPLCHECFNRYVHTKCIKRLESFRVNFSTKKQRKILVPLSLGVSSVALLHILHLHLKTQKSKTGRTGFTISAICIQGPERDSQVDHLLLIARKLYPEHEISSLPLHDVFRILPRDASLRNILPSSCGSQASDYQDQLINLIKSLGSATARADVLTTLRTRLIVEHATTIGCESILWGDSTTKLAEKTLAETAKGRGFSLPFQTDDGKSPFGINFHYPLRDVLKKELASYINLAGDELASLVHDTASRVTQTSTSSKNTTIDDLMKQYFESVEENFPSIVANVVRTTSKLKLPQGALSDPVCSFCSMPVSDGRFGIHGWGGDQHDQVDVLREGALGNFCYGCTRSMPEGTADRSD